VFVEEIVEKKIAAVTAAAVTVAAVDEGDF